MTNALFVPTVRDTDWVGELLPGVSPAALPLAGRRFIDYEIQCAHRFDVVLAEVLDWAFSDALLRDYSDLTRTGCAVLYCRGEGPRPRGLDDIVGISSPLTQNIEDGLTVVWGLCLPCHAPGAASLEPLPAEECAETPPGLYRRDGGRWMRVVPNGYVVRDARSWLAANLGILNEPALFTLPGYSAEKDVYLGSNVILEHGTEAKSPVLLQDNAWCARNVRLDGNVIVGSRAFVSEGARLERTVVADDTFVGAGLDLYGKIVVGRRVIDAETGAYIDIEEPGVVRSIGGSSAGKWLSAAWRFLQGRSKGRRA